MSAFRRHQPVSKTAEVGTRPGLQGQTLVSTGIADLDRLLGGGLPLGSLLLLLEDPASQQHLTFIKYFLAEGLACGHTSSWLAPRPQPGGAGAFLPPIAVPKQQDACSSSSSSTSESSSSGASTVTAVPPSGSATATNTASTTAAGDDGLRIAWQYRKYIQKQQHEQPQAQTVKAAGTTTTNATGSSFIRGGQAAAAAGSSSTTSTSSATTTAAAAAAVTAAAGAKALEAGVSREWCHRFDSSKYVGDAAVTPSRLQYRTTWGDHPIHELAAAAVQFVSGLRPPAAPAPAGQPPIALPVRDPAQIGRLVVQSLGGFAWRPAAAAGGLGPTSDNSSEQRLEEAALLQAVARLRLAAQDTSCAALITCPAGRLSASCIARLQHLCDGVVSLESLADDSDVYSLVPDQNRCVCVLCVCVCVCVCVCAWVDGRARVGWRWGLD